MSGRIAAIDAVWRDNKLTIIVGAASGGIWKSTDGGTTFNPMFDKQDVMSIGAVTIDLGEPRHHLGRHRRALDAQPRSPSATVSYKSTDGGQTWANILGCAELEADFENHRRSVEFEHGLCGRARQAVERFTRTADSTRRSSAASRGR